GCRGRRRPTAPGPITTTIVPRPRRDSKLSRAEVLLGVARVVINPHPRLSVIGGLSGRVASENPARPVQKDHVPLPPGGWPRVRRDVGPVPAGVAMNVDALTLGAATGGRRPGIAKVRLAPARRGSARGRRLTKCPLW